MKNQPDVLYAAIHASEFPAQSTLRLRPDLQAQPLVIMDGVAPQERVCSLNTGARKLGAVVGMTRIEIEAIGAIRALKRSIDTELAARAVLLESLSKYSPQIEETFATNACGFVLDITGSERLFGSPDAIAINLRSSMASTGFRASVCVSNNFDTARICAEFMRGINIIPINQNAGVMASIPVSALPLEEAHEETFALWGIRTLGELAKLPEEELISRLGQDAKSWLNLSRGMQEHTFQPIEATFELREHIEFETHIEQLDSLLFIGANMINRLVSRASGKALSLATLTVRMCLEKQLLYERVLRPAIPSNDRKFLLKLLQLEIAAHPPGAAIQSLTLTAEAGYQNKVQLGLFTPQTPEPSRLDVTVARLRALVGDERVGSPVLNDSHRSGDFDIVNFAIPSRTELRNHPSVRISLRRMRPPHPLKLRLESQRPYAFCDGADSYEVQAIYGPWNSSGCWWSVNQWDLEEWDVRAINHHGETVGCLIVHDKLRNDWMLEAWYD